MSSPRPLPVPPKSASIGSSPISVGGTGSKAGNSGSKPAASSFGARHVPKSSPRAIAENPTQPPILVSSLANPKLSTTARLLPAIPSSLPSGLTAKVTQGSVTIEASSFGAGARSVHVEHAPNGAVDIIFRSGTPVDQAAANVVSKSERPEGQAAANSQEEIGILEQPFDHSIGSSLVGSTSGYRANHASSSGARGADEDDDGDVEANDNLLGKEGNPSSSSSGDLDQQPSGFRSVLSQLNNYFVKPTVNTVLFAKDHPFITAAATISAIPAGVNSMYSVTGINAKDFSRDEWNAVPFHTQVLTIIAVVFTLGVNMVVAAIALPQAIQSLFNAEKWKSHPVRMALALFLALCATFTLGVVSYESLIFSKVWAMAMAGASMMLNLATRLVGSAGVLERVNNEVLRPDATFQQEYIYKLEHLEPAHRVSLNKHMRGYAAVYAPASGQTPNEEDFYSDLLKEIDEELRQAAPHELLHDQFLEKQRKCLTEECLKRKVNLAFDLSAGLLLGAASSVVFGTKFKTGINILGQWITKNPTENILDTLPTFLPNIISLLFSLGSPALYFQAGYDMREIIIHALRTKNLPLLTVAVVALVPILASGTNMYYVAKSEIESPTTILSSIIDQIPGLFKGLVTSGAIAVNLRFCLRQMFPDQDPLVFADNADIVGIVTNRFKNLNKPIATATADQLIKNGVFGPPSQKDLDLSNARTAKREEEARRQQEAVRQREAKQHHRSHPHREDRPGLPTLISDDGSSAHSARP